MAQTRQAGECITRALRGVAVELVPISTRGDRTAGPLQDVGGKGLFTAELEAALREGELDLAVHSAKDLPVAAADGLVMAAVLPREDARDALVSRAGRLEDLPAGANVGTSSLRRSALLRAFRQDIKISHLRGNVDTRLQRVLGERADFDATILAMAGLIRGGWVAGLGGNVHPLPIDAFIPAAGQGTLVLQARENDNELIDTLRAVHHDETLQSLLAERRVLRRLGASCHSCLAVHVYMEGPAWRACAMVAYPDGSGMLRVESAGFDARQSADMLTDQLLAAGAMERLGNG